MAKKEATINVTVKFSEEKIKAIKMFSTDKDMKIEAVVAQELDKIYKKVVPVQVRNYIDNLEKDSAAGGKNNEPSA